MAVRHLQHVATAVAAAAAIVAAGTVSVSAESVPSATDFPGYPQVGALFADQAANGDHYCSGAVLHSTSGDLVITAAHCVNGDGAGMTFVPGYDDGAKPYGVWQVVRAYAAPGWLASQDPQDDFAVLQIAKKTANGRSVGIEAVTGSYLLGSEPTLGEKVRVPGYNGGSDDDPIECISPVTMTQHYPTFRCHNYVSGTSGSPWLATRAGRTYLTGVIGGLHQGGCTDVESYSSPFGPDVARVLARAEAGGAGDTLPIPGDDGC